MTYMAEKNFQCLNFYTRIPKEFICNLDGILQNDFHLKSSFDKAGYIFGQSTCIWECSGHFDHWFSIIKSFLMHGKLYQRQKSIKSINPDIRLWPAVKLVARVTTFVCHCRSH